jgi:hypothetical protein
LPKVKKKCFSSLRTGTTVAKCKNCRLLVLTKHDAV